MSKQQSIKQETPKKSKRRVSFHNRTSIRLFKREHAKSLSIIDNKTKESYLNDIIEKPSILSPEPSQFTQNFSPIKKASRKLQSFSPESMSLCSSSTSKYSNSMLLNSPNGIFSENENSTMFFLETSEKSDDKENSEKTCNISKAFEPSLSDLVEADQNEDNLTLELENTADFLLTSNSKPKRSKKNSSYETSNEHDFTEEDSFSRFCTIDEENSPPSLASCSPTNSNASESDNSLSSMSSLTDQIDVDTFLSNAQIYFRIFEFTPKKISLGFPSDSLTSLIYFSKDSDPSNSKHQLLIKKLILERFIDLRYSHQNYIQEEMKKVNSISNDLYEELSICNPPFFKDIQSNLPAKRILKIWQHACTRKSKYFYQKSYFQRVINPYFDFLQIINKQIINQLKSIEKEIVSSFTNVNVVEYQENFDEITKEISEFDLKEKLLEHMDQLDIMYGLIQWKLVKSDKTKKSQSLTLRFSYCNYELSFQSTGTPSKKSLFSCVLYQIYPSPTKTHSILDSKVCYICFFYFSKLLIYFYFRKIKLFNLL